MQLFKYVATASPSIVQQQNFANENTLCYSSSFDRYINMQSKTHIHFFELNNNKLYYRYFQGIYIFTNFSFVKRDRIKFCYKCRRSWSTKWKLFYLRREKSQNTLIVSPSTFVIIVTHHNRNKTKQIKTGLLPKMSWWCWMTSQKLFCRLTKLK